MEHEELEPGPAYSSDPESHPDEEILRGRFLLNVLLVLSRIRTTLDVLGIAIYIFTACNMILVFSSLADVFYIPSSVYMYLSLAAMSFVFLTVLAFDMYRRRGNAIFEEISDELQWRVTSRYVEQESTESFERPNLDARIRLRDFVRASQLMLFPGQYGPALYMIVNVSITIAMLIFSRFLLF